jgi:hypothetical protein
MPDNANSMTKIGSSILRWRVVIMFQLVGAGVG